MAWQFWIDRGGTFTDIVARRPDGALLTTDQGIPVSHTDDSLRVGARGPTLLEDFHLREKLTRGELAGAVLDVFEPEPLPPDSPLWTTPNLIITPHVTCDDPRYIDPLFDFWFSNLERFLAGKRLKNIVDRRLGY